MRTSNCDLQIRFCTSNCALQIRFCALNCDLQIRFCTSNCDLQIRFCTSKLWLTNSVLYFKLWLANCDLQIPFSRVLYPVSLTHPGADKKPGNSCPVFHVQTRIREMADQSSLELSPLFHLPVNPSTDSTDRKQQSFWYRWYWWSIIPGWLVV